MNTLEPKVMCQIRFSVSLHFFILTLQYVVEVFKLLIWYFQAYNDLYLPRISLRLNLCSVQLKVHQTLLITVLL